MRDASPPEAVLINTSGGLTGGDRLAVSVEAEPGASAVITGQAFEKVYRAEHDHVEVETKISLGQKARIDWLPQPAILFNRARFRRRTLVAMEENSALLAVEGFVFGRRAMGETVKSGLVEDGWQIRRDGKLIFADILRLSGDVGATLNRRSVLDNNGACAVIVYVAPEAAEVLQSVRDVPHPGTVAAAASSWDGIMVVRIVAPDGNQLMGALCRTLTAVRGQPMPRVWSI